MKTSLDRNEVVAALSEFFGVDADVMRDASFVSNEAPSATVQNVELWEGNDLALRLVGADNASRIEFTPSGARVTDIDGDITEVPFE